MYCFFGGVGGVNFCRRKHVNFSVTIEDTAMKLGPCLHLDEWNSKQPSILSLDLFLLCSILSIDLLFTVR